MAARRRPQMAPPLPFGGAPVGAAARPAAGNPEGSAQVSAPPLPAKPASPVPAQELKFAPGLGMGPDPRFCCVTHGVMLVHLEDFVPDSVPGYGERPRVRVCPVCVPVELVDVVKDLYRRK